MFRPRRSRIAFAGSVDKSWPLKMTDPEILAFSGRRRKMARPRVLFPHPLSPTKPSVVPLSMRRLTSFTA